MEPNKILSSKKIIDYDDDSDENLKEEQIGQPTITKSNQQQEKLIHIQ